MLFITNKCLLHAETEAATETVFENICSFFPGAAFFKFFRSVHICSSNRHEFSRRVYMFFEQTQIFQEGLSKRHVFSRRFYLFVEETLLSHRTDTVRHFTSIWGFQPRSGNTRSGVKNPDRG